MAWMRVISGQQKNQMENHITMNGYDFFWLLVNWSQYAGLRGGGGMRGTWGNILYSDQVHTNFVKEGIVSNENRDKNKMRCE